MEEIMKKRQKEAEEAYEAQWQGGQGSHHPDFDPEAVGDDVVKASRETEARTGRGCSAGSSTQGGAAGSTAQGGCSYNRHAIRAFESRQPCKTAQGSSKWSAQQARQQGSSYRHSVMLATGPCKCSQPHELHKPITCHAAPLVDAQDGPAFSCYIAAMACRLSPVFPSLRPFQSRSCTTGL
jgi:hypothetical protein